MKHCVNIDSFSVWYVRSGLCPEHGISGLKRDISVCNMSLKRVPHLFEKGAILSEDDGTFVDLLIPWLAAPALGWEFWHRLSTCCRTGSEMNSEGTKGFALIFEQHCLCGNFTGLVHPPLKIWSRLCRCCGPVILHTFSHLPSDTRRAQTFDIFWTCPGSYDYGGFKGSGLAWSGQKLCHRTIQILCHRTSQVVFFRWTHVGN